MYLAIVLTVLKHLNIWPANRRINAFTGVEPVRNHPPVHCHFLYYFIHYGKRNVSAKKRDHKRHVTQNAPLQRRSLPAPLHVLIYASHRLFSSSYQQFKKKTIFPIIHLNHTHISALFALYTHKMYLYKVMLLLRDKLCILFVLKSVSSPDGVWTCVLPRSPLPRESLSANDVAPSWLRPLYDRARSVTSAFSACPHERETAPSLHTVRPER